MESSKEDTKSESKLDTPSRQSSILKPTKQRIPLQCVASTSSVTPDSSPPTQKIKRRVSFAKNRHIREFVNSAEQGTLWNNTYEEHDLSSTKSSNTDPSINVPPDEKENFPVQLLPSNLLEVDTQQSKEIIYNQIENNDFESDPNPVISSQESDDTVIFDDGMELTSCVAENNDIYIPSQPKGLSNPNKDILSCKESLVLMSSESKLSQEYHDKQESLEHTQKTSDLLAMGFPGQMISNLDEDKTKYLDSEPMEFTSILPSSTWIKLDLNHFTGNNDIADAGKNQAHLKSNDISDEEKTRRLDASIEFTECISTNVLEKKSTIIDSNGCGVNIANTSMELTHPLTWIQVKNYGNSYIDSKVIHNQNNELQSEKNIHSQKPRSSNEDVTSLDVSMELTKCIPQVSSISNRFKICKKNCEKLNASLEKTDLLNKSMEFTQVIPQSNDIIKIINKIGVEKENAVLSEFPAKSHLGKINNTNLDKNDMNVALEAQLSSQSMEFTENLPCSANIITKVNLSTSKSSLEHGGLQNNNEFPNISRGKNKFVQTSEDTEIMNRSMELTQCISQIQKTNIKMNPMTYKKDLQGSNNLLSRDMEFTTPIPLVNSINKAASKKTDLINNSMEFTACVLQTDEKGFKGKSNLSTINTNEFTQIVDKSMELTSVVSSIDIKNDIENSKNSKNIGILPQISPVITEKTPNHKNADNYPMLSQDLQENTELITKTMDLTDIIPQDIQNSGRHSELPREIQFVDNNSPTGVREINDETSRKMNRLDNLLKRNSNIFRTEETKNINQANCMNESIHVTEVLKSIHNKSSMNTDTSKYQTSNLNTVEDIISYLSKNSNFEVSGLSVCNSNAINTIDSKKRTFIEPKVSCDSSNSESDEEDLNQSAQALSLRNKCRNYDEGLDLSKLNFNTLSPEEKTNEYTQSAIIPIKRKAETTMNSIDNTSTVAEKILRRCSENTGILSLPDISITKNISLEAPELYQQLNNTDCKNSVLSTSSDNSSSLQIRDSKNYSLNNTSLLLKKTDALLSSKKIILRVPIDYKNVKKKSLVMSTNPKLLEDHTTLKIVDEDLGIYPIESNTENSLAEAQFINESHSEENQTYQPYNSLNMSIDKDELLPAQILSDFVDKDPDEDSFTNGNLVESPHCFNVMKRQKLNASCEKKEHISAYGKVSERVRDELYKTNQSTIGIDNQNQLQSQIDLSDYKQINIDLQNTMNEKKVLCEIDITELTERNRRSGNSSRNRSLDNRSANSSLSSQSLQDRDALVLYNNGTSPEKEILFENLECVTDTRNHDAEIFGKELPTNRSDSPVNEISNTSKTSMHNEEKISSCSKMTEHGSPKIDQNVSTLNFDNSTKQSEQIVNNVSEYELMQVDTASESDSDKENCNPGIQESLNSSVRCLFPNEDEEQLGEIEPPSFMDQDSLPTLNNYDINEVLELKSSDSSTSDSSTLKFDSKDITSGCFLEISNVDMASDESSNIMTKPKSHIEKELDESLVLSNNKSTSEESFQEEIQDSFEILQDKLKSLAISENCIWTLKTTSRKILEIKFAELFLMTIRLSVAEEESIHEIEKIEFDFKLKDNSKNIPLSYAHRFLREKLKPPELEDKYKLLEDVPKLLNCISDDVHFAIRIIKDLERLDLLNLVNFTDEILSMYVSSRRSNLIIRLEIKNKYLYSISPQDVEVACVLGDVRETDIKTLLSNVKKDYKFFSRYINDVKEYLTLTEETSLMYRK